MIIHNITIKDFKSLYGSHYFDFDKMKGLIKLSGPIGSGKTSIGEALIWGLYGNVKGQTNPGLVAWNCKACEVEINLTSKDKEVHIIRNIREPLIVEVNGKTLSASNKKDTQLILEEEIFDIPKLAVTKMCIISFNAFNSLASMNVGETKQFLDDIFGFKLFSEYNDEVKIERKGQENEALRLQSVYDEKAGVMMTIAMILIQCTIIALQYIAGGSILSSLLPGVFDIKTATFFSFLIFMLIGFVGGMGSASLSNILNICEHVYEEFGPLGLVLEHLFSLFYM